MATSSDASEHQVKSHRPTESAFKQQRLPAWQPILTAGTVLPTFFVIGIAFIPVGIGLLYFSDEVKEHVTDYTYCVKLDDPNNKTCAEFIKEVDPNSDELCQCMIDFELTEDFKGDVYFYYGLSNYYQNHRRYVKSRDDNQLLGQLSKTVSSDCEPFAYVTVGNVKKPVAPCGAIANSLFNDTFSVMSSELGEDVPVLRTGIAWRSDKKIKFRNPSGDLKTAFANFSKPINWRKNIWELDPDPDNNGFQNEDLIVWMRTAALPTFRKLYRRVDHTQSGFKTGLGKGKYALTVNYSYPVTDFHGTKSFIISTTSLLGGKNPFLGVAYIVVGTLCLVLGIILLVIHVKCSKRPFNDELVFSQRELLIGSRGTQSNARVSHSDARMETSPQPATGHSPEAVKSKSPRSSLEEALRSSTRIGSQGQSAPQDQRSSPQPVEGKDPLIIPGNGLQSATRFERPQERPATSPNSSESRSITRIGSQGRAVAVPHSPLSSAHDVQAKRSHSVTKISSQGRAESAPESPENRPKTITRIGHHGRAVIVSESPSSSAHVVQAKRSHSVTRISSQGRAKTAPESPESRPKSITRIGSNGRAVTVESSRAVQSRDPLIIPGIRPSRSITKIDSQGQPVTAPQGPAEIRPQESAAESPESRSRPVPVPQSSGSVPLTPKTGSQPAQSPETYPQSPAQYPATPSQFPPTPAQYPCTPAQYPPAPAQYPPTPAQYPPAPPQYPPASPQYPPVPPQYPPPPPQYPPAPPQYPTPPPQYPPAPPQYPPVPPQYPLPPPQYPPAPPQYPPVPPQYPPVPPQYAPTPAQYSSTPAQYPPAPAQYPSAPPQYPQGQPGQSRQGGQENPPDPNAPAPDDNRSDCPYL